MEAEKVANVRRYRQLTNYRALAGVATSDHLPKQKMTHYLRQFERDALQEIKDGQGQPFPAHKHKLLAFINLAIYPYDWAQIYVSVRKQEKISFNNWEALKGVIMAMLVVTKRRNPESHRAIDAYVLDFIELMRSDRQGDPEKFLLNMRWYFPRFLFVVGIQAAFGVEWKKLVTDTLKLKKQPEPKTYGSLFLNRYLRSMLYAYIVYKNYRSAGDEDYLYGKNDVNTLLDYYALRKYAISRETLQLLLVRLQETLPAYSYTVRRQASYAIDNALDGWNTLNSQWFENYKKHNKAKDDGKDTD